MWFTDIFSRGLAPWAPVRPAMLLNPIRAYWREWHMLLVARYNSFVMLLLARDPVIRAGPGRLFPEEFVVQQLDNTFVSGAHGALYPRACAADDFDLMLAGDQHGANTDDFAFMVPLREQHQNSTSPGAEWTKTELPDLGLASMGLDILDPVPMQLGLLFPYEHELASLFPETSFASPFEFKHPAPLLSWPLARPVEVPPAVAEFRHFNAPFASADLEVFSEPYGLLDEELLMGAVSKRRCVRSESTTSALNPPQLVLLFHDNHSEEFFERKMSTKTDGGMVTVVNGFTPHLMELDTPGRFLFGMYPPSVLLPVVNATPAAGHLQYLVLDMGTAPSSILPTSDEDPAKPSPQQSQMGSYVINDWHVVQLSLVFPCTLCSALFKVKGYLTRHMKKHNTPMLYRCPFYDLSAADAEEEDASIAALRPHVRLHSHGPSTRCHPSGGFLRKDTYKTHLRALHFIYPPGTRSSNRLEVGGRCAGCFQLFANNSEWLTTHIETNECMRIRGGEQKLAQMERAAPEVKLEEA